jgi:hypothetical protein
VLPPSETRALILTPPLIDSPKASRRSITMRRWRSGWRRRDWMPSSVNDCDGRLEDCRCVYVYCQYVYVYVEGGIGCLLRTKAAMEIGRAPGIYRIVYVCMYKCIWTCMCMFVSRRMHVKVACERICRVTWCNVGVACLSMRISSV